MPIINNQLSAEEATARTAEKLLQIGFTDVLDGATTDRLYLLLTMLHAKKCIKTVSYFKVTNGQRSKHESDFNRFVLLGVLGSDKVGAIFTTNQTDSAQLLRYCNKLVPGAVRALIRPKFESKYMGTTSATPIITTVEPLVPMNVKELPIVACPRVASSAEFLHFLIHTSNLLLSNVDAVTPVCNGIFCDVQPRGDCPCLEIDNQKTDWAISADVSCSELFHSAVIRSKRLISFFAPMCRNAEPNKNTFDVLDLDDAVKKCVDEVNAKSGWFLFGWVKPTEVAMESTNYDFEMHIVSIILKERRDILSSNYETYT